MGKAVVTVWETARTPFPRVGKENAPSGETEHFLNLELTDDQFSGATISIRLGEAKAIVLPWLFIRLTLVHPFSFPA